LATFCGEQQREGCLNSAASSGNRAARAIHPSSGNYSAAKRTAIRPTFGFMHDSMNAGKKWCFDIGAHVKAGQLLSVTRFLEIRAGQRFS